MNREFIVNILFLLFINLLIKPFFIFGIDLTVQNRIGSEYGLYFALMNLTYIFQILNDFGIQSFNNRHISQHPQLLPKYFPNLLAIKILLSVVYVVISLAMASAMQYESRALLLLLILLVNQVLIQMIFFLRSNLSGLGFYRMDSVLSSLDKLLMLFTCGLLLWTHPAGRTLHIEAFALAQTIPLALTAAIAYGLLRSKVRFRVRPTWANNWRAGYPTLLVLFRGSLPYALVVFLMFAYTRLDGVLLERFCGKAHAEVFAGAYRVLDACNMLGYLFASLLLPMFARMQKKVELVKPLLSLSFRLIWAGSVALAAAICFAREDLLHLMMPFHASPYRWDTLGVLIWAFVPVSTTYIFSTLLTAHGQVAAMNRFFIAGIGLNLLLNLLLMPRWQAFGAAIAAVSTQAFIAASMVGLTLHTFKWRPRLQSVAQVIGYVLFILLVNVIVLETTSFLWYVKMALCAAACLPGLLLFKWVKWGDIRQLRVWS
ncbi:MAG: polysaccharide biosynthesis C-terminal domain-containing protein [Saprospiraceae bacterium]|nr:polysaccharide biosynthesis C-terminal domain-containing protein [Saprospiraceae bacterium]